MVADPAKLIKALDKTVAEAELIRSLEITEPQTMVGAAVALPPLEQSPAEAAALVL